MLGIKPFVLAAGIVNYRKELNHDWVGSSLGRKASTVLEDSSPMRQAVHAAKRQTVVL
jgi:hypothetical protein